MFMYAPVQSYHDNIINCVLEHKTIVQTQDRLTTATEPKNTSIKYAIVTLCLYVCVCVLYNGEEKEEEQWTDQPSYC